MYLKNNAIKKYFHNIDIGDSINIVWSNQGSQINITMTAQQGHPRSLTKEV
jgi:hypothetical protein